MQWPIIRHFCEWGPLCKIVVSFCAEPRQFLVTAFIQQPQPWPELLRYQLSHLPTQPNATMSLHSQILEVATVLIISIFGQQQKVNIIIQHLLFLHHPSTYYPNPSRWRLLKSYYPLPLFYPNIAISHPLVDLYSVKDKILISIPPQQSLNVNLEYSNHRRWRG